jgi:RimJ/RimL family protein N-acetyltransferase
MDEFLHCLPASSSAFDTTLLCHSWQQKTISGALPASGQICLRPDKDVGDVAVGYALETGFWRQGLAREALEAVVDHGFRERSLQRIVATVRPENIASRA